MFHVLPAESLAFQHQANTHGLGKPQLNGQPVEPSQEVLAYPCIGSEVEA